MANLVELEIGCGTNPVKRPGVLNCDLYPGPNVDAVFDLQERWPFDDNSVSRINGFHVLEHIANPKAFFAEAWRVLAPGGIVRLRLPYGPSDDGLTDITHVRYWLPGTFAFLQPNYEICSGNTQHIGWQFPFKIDYVACRVSSKLRWLVKGPWKRLGLQAIWFLWGGHQEMAVGLIALKTQEAIDEFKKGNQPNMIPVAQIMPIHQLEGRELRPDEPYECVELTHGGIRMSMRQR